MQKLNEERLKEIVLCILTEIVNTSEMDSTTYLSWLKNEVGISESELSELNANGYLPMPIDYQQEI